MKKISLLLLSLLFSFGVVSAETVNVPLVGAVEVSEMPLILSTILIAGADGFNPCSIWVLLFLLGIIIHTGSRKKIALVGSVFLLVTALIYGLFISGVFTIFSFMSYISWVTYFIVGIALIFGLVNVKDYFWYKKGLSFTIPDKYKPKIFRDTRNLVKIDNNWSLVFSTAVLAAGIAIIELPCTAGLPVIWSGIIISSGIETGYFWYLALYLLVYLAIEILILLSVLISLKSFKMDEFKGRALKLIGGLLIISLGLALLFNPSIMYSISGAFGLIIGALMLAFIIILLEKMYLRYFKK